MITEQLVLNQEQQLAYNKLTEYIFSNDALSFDATKFYLLSGYAGTGKSTVINKVVTDLKQGGYLGKFGMTATTNKAVRVLKCTNANPKLFEFGTIHAFCGLKQDILHNGTVVYKPDTSQTKKLKIQGISVLIVDEVSMLNKELFDTIIDFQSKYGFKIIFVGDVEQLPPIGEMQSQPFSWEAREKHGIEKLELTEIMRQAHDNPIIRYATEIRTNMPVNRESYSTDSDVDIGLRWIPCGPINDLLREYFDSNAFQHNSDYAKVLAYRNVTVDTFNKLIREIIYKAQNLPKILDGDVLIADKPIMKYYPQSGWGVLITTNEEMKVTQVFGDNIPYEVRYRIPKTTRKTFSTEDETIQFGYNRFSKEQKAQIEAHNWQSPIALSITDWQEQTKIFRTYKCKVQYVSNDMLTETTIDILHEDSERVFNEVLASIKTAALQVTETTKSKLIWLQYFELQHHFALVKYNYALTVHKSQGSTYDYCIVHDWDLEVNSNIAERKSLKYVAATRARHKLFIIHNS